MHVKVIKVFLTSFLLFLSITQEAVAIDATGWDYVNPQGSDNSFQNALKIGEDGGVLSLLIAGEKEEITISSSKGLLCQGICDVLVFLDNGPPEVYSGYYNNGITLKYNKELFKRIIMAKLVQVTVTLSGGKSKTFSFKTDNNPLVLSANN